MSIKSESAAAPQMAISKTNVESLILEARDTLELPKDTCTAQAYKTLLGYCMMQLLSHNPEKTIYEVGEIWDAFPKSASAMRQFLWDRKTDAPSKANDLAAKLMGKAKKG